MEKIILILCSTFLIVLIVYWVMPIKKMKAVNNELKSLLQILPITQIVNAIRKKPKTSND